MTPITYTPSDINAFAQQLRAFRLRHNIGPSELSRISGVSYNVINAATCGKSSSSESRNKVADFLYQYDINPGQFRVRHGFGRFSNRHNKPALRRIDASKIENAVMKVQKEKQTKKIDADLISEILHSNLKAETKTKILLKLV